MKHSDSFPKELNLSQLRAKLELPHRRYIGRSSAIPIKYGKGALQGLAMARVYRAVKLGILPHISTQICADCGKQAHAYDHRDYYKPLDVAPVCGRCNRKRGPGLPMEDKWEEEYGYTDQFGNPTDAYQHWTPKGKPMPSRLEWLEKQK